MITSCKLPSKSGEVVDIAMGFDSIDGKHFLMIKITVIGFDQSNGDRKLME